VAAYNFASSSTVCHPKGDGHGYVLTIGGRRIYINGDTQDMLEIGNVSAAGYRWCLRLYELAVHNDR